MKSTETVKRNFNKLKCNEYIALASNPASIIKAVCIMHGSIHYARKYTSVHYGTTFDKGLYNLHISMFQFTC